MSKKDIYIYIYISPTKNHSEIGLLSSPTHQLNANFRTFFRPHLVFLINLQGINPPNNNGGTGEKRFVDLVEFTRNYWGWISNRYGWLLVMWCSTAIPKKEHLENWELWELCWWNTLYIYIYPYIWQILEGSIISLKHPWCHLIQLCSNDLKSSGCIMKSTSLFQRSISLPVRRCRYGYFT